MEVYHLIILILIIIIFSFFVIKNSFLLYKRKRDLIISHCTEDLTWIYENKLWKKFKHIYIYTKCDKDIPYILRKKCNIITITKLPNSGQEGCTYLYHIIKFWNKLAEQNVFVPASGLNDPRREDFVRKNVLGKPTLDKNVYNNYEHSLIDQHFSLSDYTPTQNKNNLQFIISKYDNLGSFVKSCFNRDVYENFKVFKGLSYSGTFSCSKVSIQKRPIHFYKKLYDECDIGPNNEVGHFIERLWVFILEGV